MDLSNTAAGEQIEMGGIVDPERGALIYRKTTQVETVEPEVGSDFTTKKIKTVTSESSWLGQGKPPEKVPLVDQEVKPWHDEEVESNPLYSSFDYVSDFHNPLYTNRQSAAEGSGVLSGAGVPSHSGGGGNEAGVLDERAMGTSDVIPLVPVSSGGDNGDGGGGAYQDDMRNADTLF